MKIAKIREVLTPQRGGGTKFDRSGGLDFFVPKFNKKFIKDFKEKNPQTFISIKGITINPQEGVLIPSGIKVNLNTVNGFKKSDHNGIIMKCDNKSGVATKLGLTIGATIIDEDYQGELHIHVINTTKNKIIIEQDFKITQMLLIPVYIDNEIEVVDEKDLFTEDSIRGTGGFGSTNKSKIKLIVAIDKNWAIGNENKLLVKNKVDMDHFVKTTKDSNILMGYNTFKSIGYKGLKNRFTYVLTTKTGLTPPKDVIFITYTELMDLLDTREFKLQGKDLFVCGGEQIYNLFLLSNNYDEAIITEFNSKSEKYDTTFDLSLVRANTEESKLLFENNELTITKYIK